MNVPWELIDGFLDDELSPGQEAELRDWLIADREHARVFVRATHLHRSLRTEMLAQKVLPREEVLSRTNDDEFDKELEGVDELSSSPATTVATPTAPRGVVPFPQSDRGRFIRARGAIFALAASIALLIGLSVWLFPPTNNEPTLAVAPGTRVTLEPNGQSFAAQDGLKLLPGDLLRISGSNGAAISYGKENTRVALNDDTELKTLGWRRGKSFELRQGKLEAVVARQRPFGPMVLLTMQAEARVLGTKFTLAATTNAARLEVNEGHVRLTRTSDGAEVKVHAGYYATASDGAELMALPFTGRVSREYWTGISGLSVGDLTTHTSYPDKPSGRDFLNSLEEPTNLSGGYGTRIRGYLYPPKTGEYRFWIAADDSAELYLSLDDSPDQKDMIASLYFRCKPREWTKYPWQQSSLIKLKAGRGYYIEVLHSKNTGTGHLAVAWQTPGRKQEIIPGAYLAPFKMDR